MLVESVKQGNTALTFTHSQNQLEIKLPNIKNEIDCQIKYSGIPQDGLIISKNKFGGRTFFGDNWPDRARHWLPTVDHPSDKATLQFTVYAPKHYKVVSNGSLQHESNQTNGIKKTVWKEKVPISTKLMVIGVADFTIGNKEIFNEIPVSSWVFPQNKEMGFIDYQYGTKALGYFSELVGPYSYEKLAHVQSKTRYGGMENASCIFYSEQSVNGKNQQEKLFAHETAHQWFGNSVTEQNWHHLWLSEGFATYLTHVYTQHFYGEEQFTNGLIKDRERVIKYANTNLKPIIDTTVTEYIQLLNANSYQKASWFLHLLREDLGDSIFFKGIKKYYKDYRNSTALTNDFRNVMETVSGKKLDQFFQQWLRQAGHPVLKVEWKQKSNRKIKIEIRQKQETAFFIFPLEIKIQYKNGDITFKTINISGRKTRLNLSVKGSVEKIILDPNTKLLFEEI